MKIINDYAPKHREYFRVRILDKQTNNEISIIRNEAIKPASCQTAVMGNTHLIVLKDWKTPYNSVKKGNHAPAYYWAEKLGKTEEKFIKDFMDGYLDEWFKVYCP